MSCVPLLTSLRRRCRRLAWVLIAAQLLLAGSAALAEERIAVLLSESGGFHREFVDALQRTLDDHSIGGRSLIELTELPERVDDPRLAGVSVLVAVGVRAMRAAAERSDLPPTLNVLVPRASYERVLAESARRRPRTQFSVIYLDQPLSRQLALIRALFPGKPRVGVLLGPESSAFLPRLRAEEARGGPGVVSEKVLSELEIIPALARVLREADLLLALPDSTVFTRDSARPILLTAYRHRKPMLGFSQAYVNAGALAAVFSTPAQIARQTAEILDSSLARRSSLPAASHPRYFSVAVNRAVARGLAIEAPADEALRAELAGSPDGE